MNLNYKTKIMNRKKKVFLSLKTINYNRAQQRNPRK